MSKPPTVSDFASTLSAVIAPVSKQLPEAIDKPVMIRPDFDTDVLWKPPRLSRRFCAHHLLRFISLHDHDRLVHTS
uniref:Uncharacterized protein n=1 Tax=Parascaris equorum TaxID=6256 RepID=A0A914RPQ0_PAREQ